MVVLFKGVGGCVVEECCGLLGVVRGWLFCSTVLVVVLLKSAVGCLVLCADGCVVEVRGWLCC